jgi:3-deoxy-7-phosphoheptulonate synthase
VMDTRKIEQVCRYSDMLQVGSRHMHSYPLLEEVGRSGKPVLLKRGWCATIDEFLFAAEYVLKEGNEQVVLCERGIRTFEQSTRNTLDLNAIPVLKRETHLPVIVDPSHGTGRWWMVSDLSRAAVAVGADGLLVEVHPDPEQALSDGAQSLRPERFEAMMREVQAVAQAVGRTVAQPLRARP